MIVTITNNKGGQGKTTTAVTLGHCLSNKKLRVLVADLDPQCNATSILGPSVKNYRTLYDLFDGNCPTEECIYPTTYRGLCILPNSPDTAALEPMMLARPDLGYTMLRDKLREYAKSNFDYIIIDCPPNLGLFSIQAMTCADSVIVPVEVGSRFAVDGLAKTINAINSIRDTHHPDLRLLRILLTKADMRTSISRATVDAVRQRFGNLVFETVISRNTAVQQAEMRCMTVVRHNPQVTASRNYANLAKELIAIKRSNNGQ